MKKVLILIVLFLTGCATGPVTATPVPAGADVHSLPTQDWSGYQASMQDFQYGSDKCPHVCWLGIDPGVTTDGEALALLSLSDQVDQNTLTATDTGIQVDWFSEKTKKLHAGAYIYFEKGLVKSISFTNMAPVTIQDFMTLLGDPQGINISMEVVDETVMHMPYSLYYPNQRVMTAAEAGDPGPHANDSVTNLTLNLGYDSNFFQPWIGYGHLDVYLAGQPIHQHSSSP